MDLTKRRRDIQVLRGIAVLAVVLFHANENYFSLGYLGVDIFFVISGFVVTPLILRIFSDTAGESKCFNLKVFYERRFYRLAPALIVTIIISAIVIFLVGPIADHPRIARQGIATLLLVGNLGAYKYSGDYFSPNPNPLVHTWSLSVEEQIYIFLPLIFVVFVRNLTKIKKTTAVILFCMLMISFVIFLFPLTLQPLYYMVGIELNSKFSFYSPFNRIWQFSAGGLAFLFGNRFREYISKIPRSIHKATMITSALVLFSPIKTSLQTGSLLATLITVIILLSKSLDQLPNQLIEKLEWVGDRSYSIYLVHMPILYVAQYSPVTQIGNGDNRSAQSLIAVVVSVLLGALSFSRIENKYRYKSKPNRTSLKSIAVFLIIIVFIPTMILFSLDRSSTFELKNSGLPVPESIPPWNWDRTCQFYSPQPNINLKPCRYGKQDSKGAILLIGDSHAASISESMISLGTSNDLNTYIFTFQGCGFILDKEELNPLYSYPYLTPDCLKHNQLILEFVKSLKPIFVVYHTRSAAATIIPNNSVSRQYYNEIVAQNLEFLMMQGAKIIHIGSVPELNLVTRIQDWFNVKSTWSTIPFEDNLFWERRTHAYFYLNTLAIFCPSEVCTNNSPNGWLFHDSNHLSRIGAEKLIPRLDPLIKRVLGGKH